MAWAICPECGYPVWWPARRFHRLIDYTCPICGSLLRRATEREALKRAKLYGSFYDYGELRYVKYPREPPKEVETHA